MVDLELVDRQKLISLLKGVPELASERGRREVLIFAGLKQLLPMIDLSGSTFISVNQIASYLSDYGRLTYEEEALGRFLNAVKNFVGLEQQEFINLLLNKYNMMMPIASMPKVSDWQGQETINTVSEKIIGENTLRPVAFLTEGLKVAHSVVYIGVYNDTQRWSGTGLLVAPDLILTNCHVLPNVDLLPNTIFRFNYEEDFDGKAQIPSEYRAKLDGIFYVNSLLDYAIVQVLGDPGTRFGWLPLLPRTVRVGERVNIIQHPQGQPKQISFQNNFVEYVGGDVVQYVTSTLPGSSGSPVLNDNWRIVALHHAGGNISEPTTKLWYYRNEGILIDSILNDLPSDIRELVDAATSF